MGFCGTKLIILLLINKSTDEKSQAIEYFISSINLKNSNKTSKKTCVRWSETEKGTLGYSDEVLYYVEYQAKNSIKE